MKTNRKKIQGQKYTTSKICTATPGSQQLIKKGEIQTLIKKILSERERPYDMKLITNHYVTRHQQEKSVGFKKLK